MSKKRCKETKLKVRGFLRGQIVDADTGRIVGDTGVMKNMVVNGGLSAFAAFAAVAAGSNAPLYACLHTQTDAMSASRISMLGSVNSITAINAGSKGTTGSSATFAGSFAGANSAGSSTIGGLGLYMTNSGSNSLFCGQIFTTSAMATNQNFNWSYTLGFATA
jgi:hypothetical protein